MTVGAEHRGRAIDLADPIRLQNPERLQGLGPLAHEKNSARPGIGDDAQLVRGLEIDLEALGLETLRGQA